MRIDTIPKWTLDEALVYIRELQPKFNKFNFHLALAGGVLNNGSSINDLDIIVMGMHNDDELNWDDLLGFFAEINAWKTTGEEYNLEGRILYRSNYGPENKQIDWFVYDIREEDKE